MFTGLIESIGIVRALTPVAGGRRLSVSTSLAHELSPGDSLATNGVCLTVVAQEADAVIMDVSPETLRVTNLGDVIPGSALNLERPVRPTSLLGGHFVQGHVDETGTIAAITTEGAFWRVTIAHAPALAPLLIPKGSVAVDGISLTVAALTERQFDVQIVPHTWAHTNLSTRKIGDRVNLEGDMLGKYVIRITELAGWTGTTRGSGSLARG